ncbi:hypothetical protein [Reichenbachiella agariperforans]|uniref:hypothetical protein n=1 Tax=Reichenbachiella agariperforans TaxID=156994 RepID=UPI001C085DF3|nr:hypothetical protein [Reichenbachiella agariperforans]MBU2912697.1 hypothetical protein [Reichenbachiella agariperforans]
MGNKVNYIKHMNAWFEKIHLDDRLNPTHVSLYLALFQAWNLNRFINPISIARSEIMQLSKIGSANTYTKCIKDLHRWQYIDYQPSNNPLKGSKVNLYTFDNTSDKSTDNTSDNSTVRALRPFINSNKHSKPYKHTNSHINENKNYNEPL